MNDLTIISLPDLHKRGIDYLDQIATPLKQVDLVLLPGDLTNSGTRQDTELVIQTVREHNPNILALCGNWDGDETNQYLTDEGINLHCQHHIINSITFWGVGGALPFIGRTEFEEDDFDRFLSETSENLQTPHILVIHQPPYNTINDLTHANKQAGSHAVRKWIEQTQPLACFTGHIHEGIGVDTIGETKIVNPGPIWHGAYAYMEIRDGTIDAVYVIRI